MTLKPKPSITSPDSSTSTPSSSPSPSSHASSQLPNLYASLPTSLRPYRSSSTSRLPVALIFDGPGRTLQSFKDECDINRIMSRYQQTGVIDHINRATPHFGDIEVVDFQSSLDLVLEAQRRFDALPSEVRDRFGNDPARLLAFVEDPSNLEEARKLRLVDSPAVPPVNAATAATAPSSPISNPSSPPSAQLIPPVAGNPGNS